MHIAMKRSKLIFALLILAWLLLAAGLSYVGYWWDSSFWPQNEAEFKEIMSAAGGYTELPHYGPFFSLLCYLAAAGALIYGPVSTVARWRTK